MRSQKSLYSIGLKCLGGHYVPATTAKIGKSLPIAGMGVGNGLTDPLIQYQYYGQLAYNWSIEVQGKPAISLQAYERIQASIPSCISMIKRCQKDTNACAIAEFTCNAAMLTPYQETGENKFYHFWTRVWDKALTRLVLCVCKLSRIECLRLYTRVQGSTALLQL